MSRRLHLHVAEVIRDEALWEPGAVVVVAVSGGLDSVCLLHALHRTRRMHLGQLVVATVDHGTRPCSAADADFVQQLADDLDLPWVRFDLTLGQGASEQVCRDARYGALLSLHADVVATAHHGDDQLETALLALMRGHGASGLSGMAYRQGRVVRPMLRLRRAELQAWAERQGLSWREDPTNADVRFLRNRLRRQALPWLDDARAGATGAALRSVGLLTEDDSYLWRLARAADPFDGDGWPTSWIATEPASLVRRALLHSLPTARASHLDAILAAARSGSGVVALPGGDQVVVDPKRVRRVALDSNSQGNQGRVEPLNPCGQTPIRQVSCSEGARPLLRAGVTPGLL